MAFRNGVATWGSRPFEPGGTGHWDRCFTYAVLLYLDPAAAIRVAEQLADADLIFAMAGLLHHHIEKWSGPIAVALAKGRSPALRGFGTQAIAHMEISEAATDGIEVPKDIDVALQRFVDHDVPREGVALCLCSWGAAGVTNQLSRIAEALVEVLNDAPHELLNQVCEVIFEGELRSRTFLREVVEALARHATAFTSKAVGLLPERFGQRFRDRVWSKPSQSISDFGSIAPAL